ncbi:Uncharacterised protein [Klebsiella pneumoniae subsp. pneumoniae]|uniref:Uncharacterized protein n=1 Tax=Klebsiella pneumoniae subsp. pneumoniae TaxID=72407 RepID=A0A378AM85_KLEPN|nr:Uncharacterised protein [Klebsiella pneumoniae subsp. pneumoniae]
MAGSQIVDAAVQAERPPAGEHRLHRLTLQQTGELGANVGFHQGVQRMARGLRVGAGAGAGGSLNTTPIGNLRNFLMQGAAQLADAASQRRGLLRQRQGGQGERRLHTAAAVVAAKHHPLHLKVVEGILQDAHDVVVGGVEHVGDIAVDKELAGLTAGEHLGGHAAVGAADPQRVGPLPVDPFFEIIRIMLTLLQRPAAVAGQQRF